MHPALYTLILFSLGWAITLYLVNCLIARSWKRIDYKTALVYFWATALVGLFGETFLDTSYAFFVGHPLWYYQILPIQGGYTSSFAIMTWGVYGFHLYLLHGSLKAKWPILRTRHLIFIFSLEALILESLVTLSAKVVFGRFLYYYLPGDLWHVTSVQNFPFYFICGYVLFKVIRYFQASPRFFISLSIFLLTVLLMTT